MLGCADQVTNAAVPASELLALQSAFVEAFPQCTDMSSDPARGITAFRPHLSLGQWRSPAEARAAQQVSPCAMLLHLPVIGTGPDHHSGVDDLLAVSEAYYTRWLIVGLGPSASLSLMP